MGLWKSGFYFLAIQLIALELRVAASEAIMRLTFMQDDPRKNHLNFEFHAKAFKFAI